MSMNRFYAMEMLLGVSLLVYFAGWGIAAGVALCILGYSDYKPKS